ncbi:MAG: GNAT family N-acetyltransferase [Treponema sp.]|nr:GNAT family N-acetyltransferase [Treponema sp.]
MFLRYTAGGYLVILPHDDPGRIVDVLLETNYDKEFCVSVNFEADFIAKLMKAGFLVMSSRLSYPDDGESLEKNENFILLPKLHLTRSVLFFGDLHIKNSIKRYLNRYELCFNSDFDFIVDRCIAVHGDYWLTSPLIDAVRDIRRGNLHEVSPVSFALYRDGKLVAGEFGIIVGGVYTSYSGYYDEGNAGTVQLILTTLYLEEHNFAFFDLGMPLEYKTGLGATDVSPWEFVSLFRRAQYQ